MKFYLYLGAFFLGVFLGSVFEINIYTVFLSISLSFFIFLISVFDKNNFKKVIPISLFIFFISLGFFRIYLFDFNLDLSEFEKYVGQNISIVGVVVDEIDKREENQKITLAVNVLNSEELDEDVKVLITGSLYDNLNYGDEIKVFGKLQKIENFENDNGIEFDYINYLGKDNIRYLIYYPKIEILYSGNGSGIKEKLFSIKHSFVESFSRVIPEPHSSLLAGLTVGAKQSLGTDLLDKFREVGLIHIVVLSGYNVTIIADFIVKIFSFLPRFASLSLGSLSIIFFAVATGGSATIVRASIMALIAILARATGRTNQMTRALFLAGAIMVIHNPAILTFDPSFQLSFVATLGLIHIAPRIEKYFGFLTERFSLREFAVATISTQIAVLPLLVSMTGEISLISPVVNILVLAFIPLTMLLGFITGVFGFFSYYLALIPGYITYILLSYELWIVNIFSQIPFLSISF